MTLVPSDVPEHPADRARIVRGRLQPGHQPPAGRLGVQAVQAGADRAALDALGLTLRPVEESVTGTLRRLAATGHLRPSRAGRLAPARRP